MTAQFAENSTGRQMKMSAPTVSSSHGSYKRTPYDFINSFHAVLNRWREETAFESDPDIIMSHTSFRALVENAQLVTPLIVAHLRRTPSKLVWVLNEAYGIAPYAQKDSGNMEAMSKAWVEWAEKNGRTL